MTLGIKTKPNIVIPYYPGDAMHTLIAGRLFDQLRQPPYVDLCNAQLVHLNTLSDKEIDFVAGLECFKNAHYVIAPGVFISRRLHKIYRTRGPIPTIYVGISRWLAKKLGLIYTATCPGSYFTGVGAKPLKGKELAEALLSFFDGTKPEISVLQHISPEEGVFEKVTGELRESLSAYDINVRVCHYAKEDGDVTRWTEEVIQQSDVILHIEGGVLLMPREELAELCQKHGKFIIGFGGKTDIKCGYFGTLCIDFDATVLAVLKMVAHLVTTGKSVGSCPTVELSEARIFMINEILVLCHPDRDTLMARINKSKKIKLVRHWPEVFEKLTVW